MARKKKGGGTALATAPLEELQTEKFYQVQCVGTTPLLMDCFPEEEVEKVLIRGDRPPPIKDMPLNKMAERKLYLDPDGVIALPSQNVFACLRDAGRLVAYEGKGKKLVTTGQDTILPLLMTLLCGEFVPIVDPETGKQASWVHDLKVGRLPQSKVANGVVRPKFENWGFQLKIMVDTNETTVETIQALFRIAGRAMGLGSMRPSCRNTYGQFVITGWEEIEDPRKDLLEN